MAVTFAAALAIMVFWSDICHAFGPMQQHESQCLICHRSRLERWVCGSQVKDEITTNEYSDWIDTFIPIEHQHNWMGHTTYYRRRWFSGTSIGCGGIAAVPRIFEERERVGELQAQELTRRFHELVKNTDPRQRLNEFHAFTQVFTDDPQSLLRPDDEN